jgi:histidyl-tRNA synthetase
LLGDFDLWRKSDALVRLFRALDALGVAEYVQFDPNVVRGLLYYTGTVFEAFDVTGGVRRAILGGGRYDNLLAEVGGESLPGTGFAMGDVVIGIVLEENGLLPPFELTPAPVLVTVFDDERLGASLRLAADLRRAGLNVACYPEAAKLQKQFKYADRIGARAVLVVGPDEAARAQVTLKNLASGDQRVVDQSAAAAALRSILESRAA